MTILPLVERELRVQARSPSCFWMRFAAALGGMLVCLPALSLFVGWTSSPAERGAFAFNGLVLAGFILCCVSGFMTVDVISREKREGTLGLLFLTRVRVLDVLLGKFGAAGLTGVCALAACVPVLVIPILTGGVTGGEAARKVLVLFDTMQMSLAAGLWGSARGRGWWSCGRSAGLMLILLVFGPLLFGGIFLGATIPPVLWPGPFGAFAAADDASYRRFAGLYWLSILVIQAISWLLVMAAGIRLRRALREDDAAPVRRAKSDSGHDTFPAHELANFKINVRRRAPLGEGVAPLSWLMRRQRGVRQLVWAGALLGLTYSSGIYLFAPLVARSLGSNVFWGMGLAFAVPEGCLFARAASWFFFESRRSGELELLMTTPEGARNMVASQWNWLKEIFWWPMVALAAPLVWRFLFTLLLRYAGTGWNWRMYDVYSVTSMSFNIVNTLLGIVALVWLGMWCGWSERSQSRAIIRVLLLAKGAPYLIGTLGSFMILRNFRPDALFSSALSNGWLGLVWCIPQILILIYYIYLFRWAKRRLEAQFGQIKPKSGLDSLLKFVYQPG